jgi:DNA-binding PadR family transcriptional regulator
MKEVSREILLGFWKAHVLHHASEREGVHGQWILEELRRHGYRLSPGTLYPLLDRMQRLGWLRGRAVGRGPRARKDYRLTPAGRKVLDVVRDSVRELHDELVEGAAPNRAKRIRSRRREEGRA